MRIVAQFAPVIALAVVKFWCIRGIRIYMRFVAVLTTVLAIRIVQSVRFVWVACTIRIIQATWIVGTVLTIRDVCY